MAFLAVLELMRVRQWYKNMLLFLPLFFSAHLLNLPLFIFTSIGFASFCAISSVNYIINDIHDMKNDRFNPEKKGRALASGKFRIWHSYLIASLLFILGIMLASMLSNVFMMILIAFFLLSQLYTFMLKEVVFADIVIIATNFVMRAVAGAFVAAEGLRPYVPVSPWLVLCTFFLALFLVSAKRESELKMLGKRAAKHRAVAAAYTPAITHSLLIISTTVLLLSYFLYVVSKGSMLMLLSLPFSLYCIVRYFYLVESGSEIARHPERLYKDISMLIGIALWALVIFIALYMPPLK